MLYLPSSKGCDEFLLIVYKIEEALMGWFFEHKFFSKRLRSSLYKGGFFFF